jgi:hypothetical protein
VDIYVSNGQRKCSETSPGLSEGLLGFTMFTLDEHKKEVYTTMQRVQNKKKKKKRKFMPDPSFKHGVQVSQEC